MSLHWYESLNARHASKAKQAAAVDSITSASSLPEVRRHHRQQSRALEAKICVAGDKTKHRGDGGRHDAALNSAGMAALRAERRGMYLP